MSGATIRQVAFGLMWCVCVFTGEGVADAQTCPAFGGGGISIDSPAANTTFYAGHPSWAIPVTISSSGFPFIEAVASWSYGTAWTYGSPYTMTLPIPVLAPNSNPAPQYDQATYTIRVVAFDSSGDAREASVNVIVRRDRCPYLTPGPGQDDQIDTDGNGIGDLCECGDINAPGSSDFGTGDGWVNVSDIIATNNCIYDEGPPPCASNPPTTHSDANNTAQAPFITVSDLVAINYHIFGSCTAVCPAYPVPHPHRPPPCQ